MFDIPHIDPDCEAVQSHKQVSDLQNGFKFDLEDGTFISAETAILLGAFSILGSRSVWSGILTLRSSLSQALS